MVSGSKLHLVREYLQRELPNYTISEKCNPDPESQVFVISTHSHSTLLKIRKCFYEHKNSRQLVDMLNKLDIAYQFKQHPDIDAFVISCAPDRCK
jgi:hypothetical protein